MLYIENFCLVSGEAHWGMDSYIHKFTNEYLPRTATRNPAALIVLCMTWFARLGATVFFIVQMKTETLAQQSENALTQSMRRLLAMSPVCTRGLWYIILFSSVGILLNIKLQLGLHYYSIKKQTKLSNRRRKRRAYFLLYSGICWKWSDLPWWQPCWTWPGTSVNENMLVHPIK